MTAWRRNEVCNNNKTHLYVQNETTDFGLAWGKESQYVRLSPSFTAVSSWAMPQVCRTAVWRFSRTVLTLRFTQCHNGDGMSKLFCVFQGLWFDKLCYSPHKKIFNTVCFILQAVPLANHFNAVRDIDPDKTWWQFCRLITKQDFEAFIDVAFKISVRGKFLDQSACHNTLVQEDVARWAIRSHKFFNDWASCIKTYCWVRFLG